MLLWGLREKAISQPAETLLPVRQVLIKTSEALTSIEEYTAAHCPSMNSLFMMLKRTVELTAIDFGFPGKTDKRKNKIENSKQTSVFSGISKIMTVDRLDIRKQVSDISKKKSVKDLILSHQMQVKAMFLKSRPRMNLSKALNEGSVEPRSNAFLGSMLGEGLEGGGQNRGELLSRANSSLDLSAQRAGSRERSRPNVSIFKRSKSSQKELSTFVRL